MAINIPSTTSADYYLAITAPDSIGYTLLSFSAAAFVNEY
jgi:hypothetical protein